MFVKISKSTECLNKVGASLNFSPSGFHSNVKQASKLKITFYYESNHQSKNIDYGFHYHYSQPKILSVHKIEIALFSRNPLFKKKQRFSEIKCLFK